MHLIGPGRLGLKASIISSANGRFKKLVAIAVMLGFAKYIYLTVYK